MLNIEAARRQMVQQQVRTWDVSDPEVLDVLGQVPRDEFVPREFAHCAYADVEIPLPHGQCMLRPSLVGRILQAIDCCAGDAVLEIGTGTGYLTRCLASVAGQVTSIDLYQDFVDEARQRLADESGGNVQIHCMDAESELPDGEFDVIVVTSAMKAIDERLTNALKPNGRLFVVVGTSPVMTATLVTRQEDGQFIEDDLFETQIPPLVSKNDAPVFSF